MTKVLVEVTFLNLTIFFQKTNEPNQKTFGHAEFSVINCINESESNK